MDRLWTIHTTDPNNQSGTPWRSVRISDLPVTSFKIKFCSRASDEVRLRFETDSNLTDPEYAWSLFAIGKLYWFTCAWESHGVTIEDKPMFCGTLTKTSPSDEGTSKYTDFVFLGGWYYLEQTIYRNSAGGILLPSPVFTLSATRIENAIRSILWCASGNPYSGDSNAHRGISYSDASGPNHETIRACVSHGTTSRNTAWNPKIPETSFNSHTCAEALERVISYWPDYQTWTGFTKVMLSGEGSPYPRFYVKRLRSKPTVEIPMDVDTLPVPSGEDSTGWDPAVEEGSSILFGSGEVVSRSYDWINPLCPGVRVYRRDANLADNKRTFSIGEPDDLGGLTVATNSDDSDGTFMFFNQLLEDDTVVPASLLPGEIDRMMETPHWEGTVVLLGKDPPGLFTIRPNKYLSLGLTDRGPGIQNSPIQSVEFNIGLGQTTIECGWPSSADPDDLISLVKANRYDYQWGDA